MTIKAIIFDFDGVLTDTEPVHMEAWLAVLERFGISFDQEEYDAHYIGLNDRDFLDAVGHIHGHHFENETKAALIEEKSMAALNLLEKDIPVLPGVSDFLEKNSQNHIFAICSGANRGEIEFILKRLKWMNLFSPIIASDSVKKGKPDPEGYIRALEGLVERSNDLILAENVLAIEDSPKGIAAAKSAGLKCLAVKNSFSDEALQEADWIVDSLAAVIVREL